MPNVTQCSFDQETNNFWCGENITQGHSDPKSNFQFRANVLLTFPVILSFLLNFEKVQGKSKLL